ncbi:hypothetical protein D3C78_1310910 [compost metagenome]
MSGQFLEQLFIGQVDTMITRRERQQTVQRTGIQQIPVQAPGQHPGDGALAGTARSVDGDDRSNIDHD